MDVRNVYNPLHQEFLEVMKDPILRHPKVHDWGGGNESGLGPEPYVKTRTMFAIIDKIFCEDSFIERLLSASKGRDLVVYGMNTVGKALVSRMKNECNVAYCLDRKMDGMSYLGIPIHGINHFDDLDKNVFVVIALSTDSDKAVEKMLESSGYDGNVLRIRDLMREFNG